MVNRVHLCSERLTNDWSEMEFMKWLFMAVLQVLWFGVLLKEYVCIYTF